MLDRDYLGNGNDIIGTQTFSLASYNGTRTRVTIYLTPAVPAKGGGTIDVDVIVERCHGSTCDTCSDKASCTTEMGYCAWREDIKCYNNGGTSCPPNVTLTVSSATIEQGVAWDGNEAIDQRDKYPDSFVKVTVDSSTQQTGYIPNTQSPVWEHTFQWSNVRDLSAYFQMYDYDLLGWGHDYIGSKEVSLAAYNGTKTQMKVVLNPNNTAKGGASIYVDVVVTKCCGDMCNTCSDAASCLTEKHDCQWSNSLMCFNTTTMCGGTACSTCYSIDACTTVLEGCLWSSSSSHCYDPNTTCATNWCDSCSTATACINKAGEYEDNSEGGCQWSLEKDPKHCYNVSTSCSGNTCQSCSSRRLCEAGDLYGCRWSETLQCFNLSTTCDGDACSACFTTKACYTTTDRNCTWSTYCYDETMECGSSVCSSCSTPFACLALNGCRWNDTSNPQTCFSPKPLVKRTWVLPFVIIMIIVTVVAAFIVFLIVLLCNVCNTTYCCEMGNNHSPKKYIEVVGFSTVQCKPLDCVCGNFLCWIAFFVVLAIFILFPLSFAGAATDVARLLHEDPRDGTVFYYDAEYNKVPMELPVFFYVFGGKGLENSAESREGGSGFMNTLFVLSVIWGILDFIVCAIVIYRKMKYRMEKDEITKNVCDCCAFKMDVLCFREGCRDCCCDCCDDCWEDMEPVTLECRPFMLMISMVAVRLWMTIAELIGLFSFCTPFLMFWPISNALRIYDAFQCLVCRTGVECQRSCYFTKYNAFSWISDIIGSGLGFSMDGDAFWEKVATIALELIDITFSLLYTLNDFGWWTPAITVLHGICILKVISLSFNITLSLKSYVWINHYTQTLWTGALLGAITLLCFLLMVLGSMGVLGHVSAFKYTSIISILITAIAIFALVVVFCARTNLDPEASIFHRDDTPDPEDPEAKDPDFKGFWDGECLTKYDETKAQRARRIHTKKPPKWKKAMDPPPARGADAHRGGVTVIL